MLVFNSAILKFDQFKLSINKNLSCEQNYFFFFFQTLIVYRITRMDYYTVSYTAGSSTKFGFIRHIRIHLNTISNPD